MRPRKAAAVAAAVTALLYLESQVCLLCTFTVSTDATDALPAQLTSLQPHSSRATPLHPTEGNRVAVCVTGMRARLLPASLLTQLVVPNANWQFDLIFVLAAEQGVYYTTRYDSRTTQGDGPTPSRPQHEVAPFGSLNEVELSHAVEAEARSAHRHNDASSALANAALHEFAHPRRMSNVGIHVLNFSRARSAAAWRREFGLPSYARLDRIYKYEQIEDRLLNMYAHHVKCAAKV